MVMDYRALDYRAMAKVAHANSNIACRNVGGQRHGETQNQNRTQ